MDSLFSSLTLETTSKVVLDSISSICENTSQTADNTKLGGYDWITLLVAVLALITSFAAMIYAKQTLKSQKSTEEYTLATQGNTQRISLETQRGLLIDLVRHLYRNFVVTYAIKTKLNHLGYDKYYPSEEHLLKLKAPVENIHPEAFYDNKHYTEINKLYLLLRNYNTEIDVALSHFSQREIDIEVKKRDLGTLLLKPELLVKEIIDCLCKFYSEADTPASNKDDIYREAADIIRNAAKGNQSRPHGDTWAYEFTPYDDINSRFITSIFAHTTSRVYAADEFLNMFNTDALIECGDNEKGSPKIYMIKYTNNK